MIYNNSLKKNDRKGSLKEMKFSPVLVLLSFHTTTEMNAELYGLMRLPRVEDRAPGTFMLVNRKHVVDIDTLKERFERVGSIIVTEPYDRFTVSPLKWNVMELSQLESIKRTDFNAKDYAI